jgi:hypothetical protein
MCCVCYGSLKQNRYIRLRRHETVVKKKLPHYGSKQSALLPGHFASVQETNLERARRYKEDLQLGGQKAQNEMQRFWESRARRPKRYTGTNAGAQLGIRA